MDPPSVHWSVRQSINQNLQSFSQPSPGSGLVYTYPRKYYFRSLMECYDYLITWFRSLIECLSTSLPGWEVWSSVWAPHYRVKKSDWVLEHLITYFRSLNNSVWASHYLVKKSDWVLEHHITWLRSLMECFSTSKPRLEVWQSVWAPHYRV